MTTLQEMEQLALYSSIKDRLRKFNHNSILGLAIETGVCKGKMVETIRTIRSQAGDNHASVESVVGEKLLSDILKLEI